MNWAILVCNCASRNPALGKICVHRNIRGSFRFFFFRAWWWWNQVTDRREGSCEGFTKLCRERERWDCLLAFSIALWSDRPNGNFFLLMFSCLFIYLGVCVQFVQTFTPPAEPVGCPPELELLHLLGDTSESLRIPTPTVSPEGGKICVDFKHNSPKVCVCVFVCTFVCGARVLKPLNSLYPNL